MNYFVWPSRHGRRRSQHRACRKSRNRKVESRIVDRPCRPWESRTGPEYIPRPTPFITGRRGGVALIAKQPIQTIHRNIYPTQLLLDELRRQLELGKRIPMFLASTSEVYGKNPKPVWNEEDDLVFGSTTKPRWSYGASKAIDEFLALACHREVELPVVIGRFFNVVGPRQTGAYGMVLPRFVAAALEGRPLIVHDDGQQQRCFAHVRDVVGAIIKLVGTPESHGRVYNIGSDQR